MKRIGIDARIYGPAFTEIGIYTQHLLEELAKLAPSDITFVVFAAEVHRREIESLGENFEFVPVCVLQYSFAEQITFPITLKKARLDLMHFVHFNTPLLYRGRSVVTIHDLILSLYPGKSVGSWFQRFAYTLTLKNIVRRAASIITVSHHTKRDLIELMQIDESSIVPIHN